MLCAISAVGEKDFGKLTYQASVSQINAMLGTFQLFPSLSFQIHSAKYCLVHSRIWAWFRKLIQSQSYINLTWVWCQIDVELALD